MIDASDAAWAGQWRWCISKGYVSRAEGRRPRRRLVYLHRELLGLPRMPDERESDHRDLDRLNNRRGNLRVVTHAGNMQNFPSIKGSVSQHRGVTWDKARSKWRAQVRVAGQQFNLGRFDSEQEAANAARAARARLMPFALD